MKYNHSLIEKKWQEKWDDLNTFKAEIDYKKPKYYVLEMFPYPSGAIHMGHVRNYTLGDLIARYKKAQGCSVRTLKTRQQLGQNRRELDGADLSGRSRLVNRLGAPRFESGAVAPPHASPGFLRRSSASAKFVHQRSANSPVRGNL